MLACHLPTRKITKFSEHELASVPRATSFTWEAISKCNTAVSYCISFSFFYHFFCVNTTFNFLMTHFSLLINLKRVLRE